MTGEECAQVVAALRPGCSSGDQIERPTRRRDRLVTPACRRGEGWGDCPPTASITLLGGFVVARYAVHDFRETPVGAGDLSPAPLLFTTAGNPLACTLACG